MSYLARTVAHGQKAVTNNATAIAKVAAVDPTFNTSTDYSQITGIYDVGGTTTFLVTEGTDSLTVLKAGVYRIDVWGNFKSDTVTTRLAFKWAKNGVIGLQRKLVVTTGSAGVSANGCAYGLWEFAVGDVITFWMASDKTANITPVDMLWTITLEREL